LPIFDTLDISRIRDILFDNMVIDEVYTTLLSFDITAKAFVPRQTGYTGGAPAKLGELGHNSPQIKFRKDFLTRYIVKLVTMNYEANESWEYLDKVGLMHTGVAGFAHRAKKPGLRVEYMHCAILLGFVEDILLKAIMALPDLDLDAKAQLVRSFNKVLWIQNDLFARHYIADQEVSASKISFEKGTAALLGLGLLSLGAGIAHYLWPC